MRRTAALAASKVKQCARSLALSVHFKHPDLGMKDYEILSRATAFLVSVDPPNPQEENPDSPFGHLSKSREERETLMRKQHYSAERAGGPSRDVKLLNWLEFCPGKHRPLVHVLASSHVLSPWQWKQYYPQPWLELITQEHVRYSVDVYDNVGSTTSDLGSEPLATFALNPYPIHHPEQMDLAMIHLKNEESALKQMNSLGLEVMHLTDSEKIFEKDDEVLFEGFEIADEHYEAMEAMSNNLGENNQQGSTSKDDDDTRIFMPYKATGNLIFASPTRFLASTPEPLPEGLCGGPVIDEDSKVCGIVEGIIPKEHEDDRLAGAASLIPYFQLHRFIEYAERFMLEQILPKNAFDKVVRLKDGKPFHDNSGGKTHLDLENDEEQREILKMDEAYASMVEGLRKAHTPEQVEAILGTVEREQQEVTDILTSEGGDMDEVIAKVRARTRQKQREILEEMSMAEAEIVSERKD